MAAIQLIQIENDFDCFANVWRLGWWKARFVMSSNNLSREIPDQTIDDFRRQAAGLSFKSLSVKFERENCRLSLDGWLRLPWLGCDGEIDKIIEGVFRLYEKTLWPYRQVMDHPMLGRLSWNGEFEYWEGKVKLDGIECDLTLRDWGERPVEVTAAQAEAFLKDWSNWSVRIRQAIIRDLFELYNETWREPDQPRLTIPEFFSRLRLKYVNFDDVGWCGVSFGQQDLFTDHDVEVRVSPEGNVKALLEG